MDRNTLSILLSLQAAGQAAVRAVRISDGAERLIDPWADDLGTNAPTGLAEAAHEAARADTSSLKDIAGEAWFLQVFNPPIHLIVIGAVHAAAPLVEMAHLTGWRATIIDPRTAFAAQARFPGRTLLTGWPDEAMQTISITARSAIVALTHDPKLDDPALAAALRSRAFYIGALGSRRTHAARIDRLKAQGFKDSEVARIAAPVGLDIGALSPAEIAVSIMAEIIERFRKAHRA